MSSFNACVLNDFKSINGLASILKENFLIALKQFEEEGLEVRNPGNSTLDSLSLLKKGCEWRDIPYNFSKGGSGASMRSLCVGLAFYGEENRDKLIQISIETSRMTNNSASGYLGGFASALFTALAIEGKKINDWPFILLELFDVGKITKYIESVGRDVDKYKDDHHVFLGKWHRYVDDKFDNNRNKIIRKSNRNLIYRCQYYRDTFSMTYLFGGIETKNNFIGSGGDDSMIIAYDCLIDAGDNWEKLVYYSMLHMGDADTTGAIAGGLYGALYGYENIPNNFTEHLEYKNELINIGTKLFKKYYKS